MASLIQDLGILEAVVGDVAAFAAGSPVTQEVDGYKASVVLLPTGPVTPYVTFSGNFLSLLETVLAEAAAFAAGGPISVAEKFGNTWYGVSLTKG